MAKTITLEQLKKAAMRGKTDAASRVSELAGIVADGFEEMQHAGVTITLPISGWNGGEQTVLNEAFIADAGYWYLVHNDAGIQAEDITEDGQITFKCESIPAEDVTARIIRLGISQGGGALVGEVFNLTADRSGGSPAAGVASFNGRKGEVTPQTGDYTAAMVGARPDTWTPTAAEVGALPKTTKVPSKTSDLTNDAGFITGYTETDPTVPAWAKAESKPTYTASEVGALPSNGTAAAATKLATARTIRTNLASTGTASFNGTGNITPGVTGILPVANGGTGASTSSQAKTNLGIGDTIKIATSAPSVNYLWLDINSGGVLKYYSNAAWHPIAATWG